MVTGAESSGNSKSIISIVVLGSGVGSPFVMYCAYNVSSNIEPGSVIVKP